MTSLYHLSLEKEVLLELSPFGTPLENGQAPTVRRETVLAMVARSAQLSVEFRELLNEAGLLAASALEMQFFGSAEIRRMDALNIEWGIVSDSARNVDPKALTVPWKIDRSAFAHAIEAGHPLVLAQATQDTRFRDPLMVEHGVQTGIICPISYREQQYGAIGVFTAQPRTLSKSEVMFVQSLALLLGPTRAHQHMERTLAEHSRFLSSTIDSLDAHVVLLAADGSVMQINRACQSLSGFHADELRGRKVWNAFFGPSDGDSIQATLNEMRSGGIQRRCDTSLLTKSGEQRRISWTFARLSSSTGGATFLATGIDVTEQYGVLTNLHPPEPPAIPTDEVDRDDQLRGRVTAELLNSDRRTHDRRPFSCVQSIAACLEGRLPDRQQFRAVRCHDISPRGFSFLLSAPPDFAELVAAFGSAQSRLFLRARVVHQTPFHYEGRNVLLIGCEYTGRVRLPWGGPV